MHSLSAFEFDLPDELIARFPTSTRTASRLLYYNKTTGCTEHLTFAAIDNLLRPSDLLVFNNTKVIKARFYGHKTSGGRVEVLVERVLSDKAVLAQLKVSKPPKPGDHLHFADDIVFEVLQKKEQFYHLQLVSSPLTVNQVL